MKRIVPDDFKKFHDNGCMPSARIVYFGSDSYGDDGYGESGVDFSSAATIIKNLLYLDDRSNKPIIIHYNSPGGDWDRGIAVYDCIKGLRSQVIIIGYGCVRSMGTVIMQACSQRCLTPNCRFMIHDGTFGVYGTQEDTWRNAKEGEVVRGIMHDIYLEKMQEVDEHITKGKIRKMCEHDYYMSGQKAVDIGLADEVLS